MYTHLINVYKYLSDILLIDFLRSLDPGPYPFWLKADLRSALGGVVGPYKVIDDVVELFSLHSSLSAALLKRWAQDGEDSHGLRWFLVGLNA